MWTNIFRIGELQIVSWFQFLPFESDPNSLSEKSLKAEQKDAATYLVLSAHLQLQNEGFLSTWTNSFVGPWDPSQGVHNPDEKVKLWLFLPGRHSSIIETAQAAVSRLRVVGTGIWLAPGDSEEVAFALSQALRNSIERGLGVLSYVRFGDVFTRCHSLTPSERNFRRVQPAFEFIFTATEEAIYVHAIISAKFVRGLCSDDMERILRHRSSNSIVDELPVIVSPSGMRGRLTGCCPADLVKQVYSKHKTSNGCLNGLPFHMSQSSSCQLRGQSCFAEVTLGCPPTYSDGTSESNTNQNKEPIHPHIEKPCLLSVGRGQQKDGSADHFPILERTFIYPAETVLIPIMHRAFTRSSLKRVWVQGYGGTSLFELWPLWNLSGSSRIEHCFESFDGDGVEFTSLRPGNCSSSISSSISSVSSTSSESAHEPGVETGDLEADADSFTCRQSGLSSNDQFEKEGHKMVSKRMRAGTTETFSQAGTLVNTNIPDAYKSEYSSIVNNSATIGVTSAHVGPHWDWDDDDKGIGIDILLSEFGDFGDFFEDDVLAFGEPPGTAESQAVVFPGADFGDVSSSSFTEGMPMSDQKLSPSGLMSLEGFNQSSLAVTEDIRNATVEVIKDPKSFVVGSYHSAPSAGKFEYITKAEAMLTFAPEYAAIESPISEFSMSIFRSPYLPTYKKVESSHSSSNAYVYSATPPSPCIGMSEGNFEAGPRMNDLHPSIKSLKLYTQEQNKMEMFDNRSSKNDLPSCKGDTPSIHSSITSSRAALSLQRQSESTLDAGHFLLSLKPVLASEIECSMFQAAMCRIRHALLSLSNRVPNGLSKITGNSLFSLMPCNSSTKTDTMPSRYELKKKDSIPVRFSGDDSGMFDGPTTAQVGVWRSVGAPKVAKNSNTRLSENPSPLPRNTFHEDNLIIHGQRMPLHDIVDAMALLVQQSTSFVDVSLDTDDCDGSYCWLALQEQRRRGFSCGPSMVHAGCGGLLATCHSVDIAGVNLIDPVSADVQVSSVISLLQSDIKVALKSAFAILDGPLSVMDWCKGRSQSGDSVAAADAYSFHCSIGEVKESSSVTLVGEPISPSQSTGGSSSMRDGSRIDESSQRRSSQEICNTDSEQQKYYSRLRPTLSVLPLPSILVGYQDDWLKISASTLQFWEKAPFEPYALQKPVTYYALCPDIDLLTSAATDFFQQLGTVYEACKLGSHSPQSAVGQMDLSPGKSLPSGLILVDCPEEVKVERNSVNSISLMSDFFISLSKSWSIDSFVKSLRIVLMDLKLAPTSLANQKESSTGPCTVVYVVCPFPEPAAVLRTIVECSAALGSVGLSSEKERRPLLYSQVAKALSWTAGGDEASASNVLTLSGFSIPKLVLQIVTVETLLRVNKPASELAILKDIAFTVYNKVRRIPRSSSSVDFLQPSAISGRSQSTLMHVTSPIPSLWKDLGSRISGQTLARESELDVALRPGTWDSSWQTSRIGGLNCDPNRSVDQFCQDDARYMFEPLFILAEPGSVDNVRPNTVFGGAVLESSNTKPIIDDGSGTYMQNSTSEGNTDIGTGTSDYEQRTASLQCCYGWTEDWRWLVCIWTDSRGELLDSNIFPFGGISSRQDTKVLQSLFVQVLHQGCQILSCSFPDGMVRPRDIVITRIGCLFELECQEWQKAIYSVGGNEVKKWPLQLRRSIPDGVNSNTTATSMQQQDLGLIQERNLPSSPSPPFYSPHAKSSFVKGGLGQANSKKQLLPGQTAVGSSRGFLQLVQSISLVGVSIDHSLQLVLPADISSSGGGSNSSQLEGFGAVKSLGSMPSSYILIPSPGLRYLPSAPLQLPTCLTLDSPPLAHLLHSKGSAIPIATGFVVSKAVPTTAREDWPSVLAVSLVDYYGCGGGQEKASAARGAKSKLGIECMSREQHETVSRWVLETAAAELHALSWMTVSPVYPERRTALPFHCDMLLRLRRLLHYADKELSRPPENARP